MSDKKKFEITVKVEKDGEKILLNLTTSGTPTISEVVHFLQLAIDGAIKQAQKQSVAGLEKAH